MNRVTTNDHAAGSDRIHAVGRTRIEWSTVKFSGDYYRALITGRAQGLGPALQRGGLRFVSVPYDWSARLRNWLYGHGWRKQIRASVPVVSVGNLTLGGTGKTPFVEYIARWFRQRRRRVAILSRGYAGNG